MHPKKVIKNVLLKISIPVWEENWKVKRLTAAVRYCSKLLSLSLSLWQNVEKCSREISRPGNELKHKRFGNTLYLDHRGWWEYGPDDGDRKGPRNISYSLKHDAPDDRDYNAEGLSVHSLLITGGGCIIHDATRGFIVMKLHASCNLLLYDYIGHGNISVMGFWFHRSFWFVLTVERFTYLIIILTKTASAAESTHTFKRQNRRFWCLAKSPLIRTVLAALTVLIKLAFFFNLRFSIKRRVFKAKLISMAKCNRINYIILHKI